MQSALASELAWKLYDAAALLKIALASRHEETLREAQQRAVDVVEEAQERGTDGGLMVAEMQRLKPLVQTLACLLCASANPELVGTVIPPIDAPPQVRQPAAA